MIRQTYPEHIKYLDPQEFQASPFNMREVADEKGLAFIKVDESEPLSEQLMWDLAKHLGNAMLAKRPSVREQAYKGSVIKIKSLIPRSSDETQHVYSTEGMGLHIDESGLPVEEQPTYFMLGCVKPPSRQQGGDTVLTFNNAIFSALSSSQQELLALAHQRFPDDGNRLSKSPFISELDGKRHFSVWDAGTYGKEWLLDPPVGASERDVTKAVKTFFDAALDPENIHAIPWQANTILVANNHANVHGRTSQQGDSDRELLHVKIQSPE